MGRLTFDDAIGSINYVMKKLKGEPKKNVNFPGFIVPLEVNFTSLYNCFCFVNQL